VNDTARPLFAPPSPSARLNIWRGLSAGLFVWLALATVGRSEEVKKPQIYIYWNSDFDLLVKTQETKIPRIDRMLDLLDIRPGMTVLVIGGGTGQQAYRIAERLKGTGRVYSTDIEPVLVDYVREQAKKRGFANVESVLVSPKGVDPFYRKHRYDLIILSDLSGFLHDRVNYYREFKDLLSESGRFVQLSVQHENFGFVRDDFKDWPGFIEDLRKEPMGTPYWRALIRPALARANAGAAGDDVLERSVLFYLNRNLTREFFAEFADGIDFRPGLAFTDEERPYALWLLRRLKIAGLPKERTYFELLGIDILHLTLLNKLIFIQRYRPYLRQDGDSPYLPRTIEAKWNAERDVNKMEFGAAGYKFVKKFDFRPFQAIWVFSKD